MKCQSPNCSNAPNFDGVHCHEHKNNRSANPALSPPTPEADELVKNARKKIKIWRELIVPEIDRIGGEGDTQEAMCNFAERLCNHIEALQRELAAEREYHAITRSLHRDTRDELASARERTIEACAKVCDDQAVVFRSDEYATHQPYSSHQERFACKTCADAIRALAKPTEKEKGE